jgi:hypothetical protein
VAGATAPCCCMNVATSAGVRNRITR